MASFRIPQLLARGNGLRLAGKSKLLAAGSPLFESSVHIAMSSNRDSLPGLLASIGALLTNTLAPTALAVHLLMPWAERDARSFCEASTQLPTAERRG